MNPQTTQREAYNYTPDRKSQGYYLDQMKEHAGLEIPNDEAATMKCASFRAFDFVCKYIRRTEGIRKDRVYGGLRLLGYNRCYNKMKSNFGADVFTEITRLVDDAESRLSYTNMMRTEIARGFIDVTMTRKNYRVKADVKKVALDTADAVGIRTAELNLYHAMHGVRVLIENEPDFILIRENEIITDVMQVLTRADQGLIEYKNDLVKLR